MSSPPDFVLRVMHGMQLCHVAGRGLNRVPIVQLKKTETQRAVRGAPELQPWTQPPAQSGAATPRRLRIQAPIVRWTREEEALGGAIKGNLMPQIWSRELTAPKCVHGIVGPGLQALVTGERQVCNF